MAINPLQLPPSPTINSNADFTPLANLGNVYREAKNREGLESIGKGLADGSINYRQAAGMAAQAGNVDASLKFLALQQQKDELAGTERAGQIAADAMPGIVGAPPAAGNAAAIAPPPTVNVAAPAPQPNAGLAVNPAAAAPPPVAAAPAAAAPLPPPDKNYVTPGGTVNGMPQDQAQARTNLANISKVLALRNLPAGARATYEKLYDYNLAEIKDPNEIKELRALQQNPELLAIDLQRRRAIKPETNVITEGEKEESKRQGESTVKIFEEVAKAAPAARQKKAQLEALGDLDTRFKTGGPAALQAALAGIGIKVGKNVDVVEAYSSIIDNMVPAQRIPGSGVSTDKDQAQFKKGLPQIINSPGGNQIIRGTQLALADDQLAQADISKRYLTKQITAKQALKESEALPDPFALYKKWQAEQDKGQSFNTRFDAARPGAAASAGWSAEKVP